MGLLDNIGNKLSSMSDDDKRGMALGLASGFAGMSGNPNSASIMAGISDQQKALAARREQTSLNQQASQQNNRTAQMLIGKGGKYAEIGQALLLRQIDGKQAMAMHDTIAGKKEIKREIIKGVDGFNYYADNQERVIPNAIAPDPKLTAFQDNYKFLTDKQGKTPEEALKILKSGTNIQVGADGKPQTELEKEIDKSYAKDYLTWTQGGGADMAGQVAQIGNVLSRLEGGENLTGPMFGLLQDLGPTMSSIFAPQATDASELVSEVVQRNLRIILGAQFTEKEGAALIKRAYNPALPPKENAARLRKLYTQMQSAVEQRTDMARYTEENGTLKGYKGKRPTVSDFHNALNTYTAGHVVRGYRFLGGDPSKQANWEKI